MWSSSLGWKDKLTNGIVKLTSYVDSFDDDDDGVQPGVDEWSPSTEKRCKSLISSLKAFHKLHTLLQSKDSSKKPAPGTEEFEERTTLNRRLKELNRSIMKLLQALLPSLQVRRFKPPTKKLFSAQSTTVRKILLDIWQFILSSINHIDSLCTRNAYTAIAYIMRRDEFDMDNLHLDISNKPHCSREEMALSFRYRRLLFKTMCYVRTKLSELVENKAKFAHYPLSPFAAAVIAVCTFRLPGVGSHVFKSIALTPQEQRKLRARLLNPKEPIPLPPHQARLLNPKEPTQTSDDVDPSDKDADGERKKKSWVVGVHHKADTPSSTPIAIDSNPSQPPIIVDSVPTRSPSRKKIYSSSGIHRRPKPRIPNSKKSQRPQSLSLRHSKGGGKYASYRRRKRKDDTSSPDGGRVLDMMELPHQPSSSSSPPPPPRAMTTTTNKHTFRSTLPIARVKEPISAFRDLQYVTQGIPAPLEPQQRSEFLSKHPYLFGWHVFHSTVLEYRMDQEDAHMHQLSHQWTHLLANRRALFFTMVTHWMEYVRHYMLRLRRRRHHHHHHHHHHHRDSIRWCDVPGYLLLTSCITYEMDSMEHINKPLMDCTRSLLHTNQSLINYFMYCAYRRTNAYETASVTEMLNQMSAWFVELSKMGKLLPIEFDVYYFTRGLQAIFDTEHHQCINKVLIILYKHAPLFSGDNRMLLFGDFLLKHNFFKLFLHWDVNIRNTFHQLLIYRMVRLTRAELQVEGLHVEHLAKEFTARPRPATASLSDIEKSLDASLYSKLGVYLAILKEQARESVIIDAREASPRSIRMQKQSRELLFSADLEIYVPIALSEYNRYLSHYCAWESNGGGEVPKLIPLSLLERPGNPMVNNHRRGGK